MKRDTSVRKKGHRCRQLIELLMIYTAMSIDSAYIGTKNILLEPIIDNSESNKITAGHPLLCLPRCIIRMQHMS